MLYFFSSLFLLLLIAYLLLRTSPVQTWITQKIASYYSEKLHTKVEVGGVDIGFFNKIILEKVYVQDLHKDTLLYAQKIALSIGKINRETHHIFVKNVEFKNMQLALITYKNEKDLNLQFIIDEFASTDTTADTTSTGWHFKFGGLALNNVDFKLQDRSDTSTTTGINFSDLHAENIHAQISDVEFFGDTIRATIVHLSTTEKSGFQLRDFTCYVKLSPIGMELDQLHVVTAESDISTDLIFKYKKYSDFIHDFDDNVHMKAIFNKSQLEMNDIAYFSPDLKGMYKTLFISGDISGTVSDLRGKNMNILFGENTQFFGDVDMTGLPDFSKTYMHLDINRLTTTREDLEQIPIPPFNEQKTLKVPENLGLLGKIIFRGNFTGFYSDFVAYGDFSTALGNISSDMDMKKSSENAITTYSGKIKSDNFDIGKFLGIGIIGKISLDGEVDGTGLERDDIAANIKGAIKNFEFNNYNYQNLNVEGKLAKKVFKGMLAVRDTNLNMDFNGNVDFNEKIPVTDFVSTINRADLNALHFVKTKTPAILSTQLTVNVTGNNGDDLLGDALIGKTSFIQDNKIYQMNRLNIVSQNEANGEKSVFLSSDFLDASIKGNFELNELPNSLAKLLNHFVPSYISAPIKDDNKPENFTYSVHFNQPNPLTELFIPKLTIGPNSFVTGSYNSANQKIILNAKALQVVFSEKKFSQFYADVTSNEQKIKISTGCQRLAINDSIGADNLALQSTILNDSINWKLIWKNNGSKDYSGNFGGLVSFDNHPQIKIKLLHSQVVLADSVWKMSDDNQIDIDTSQININDLCFRHGQQSILLTGNISENKSQSLKIKLDQFKLDNLNHFIENSNLVLDGSVDGTTILSDLYHNPVFSSDINFSNIKLNQMMIGNGSISTIWDSKKQGVYLHGNFTKDFVPNIQISGFYYPMRDSNNIDMEVVLQKMQMQIFKPFVIDYCKDFDGQFGGDITIKGDLNRPLLGGNVSINAKKVTVNYLNTSYSFNQNVILHPTSFRVDSLILNDPYGHTAIVNGSVFHDNFKNFQLDFDVEANNFLCLNTSDNTDNLYYGTAFGTGIMNIYGFLNNNISIDASLQTEKINYENKILNTKIFIPLSGPQEASDNDFVRFVKKDSAKVKKAQAYKVSQSGLTLNLNVEATPDAQMEIIFDSKIGDVIKATGNGNMKMTLNSSDNFNMYGDYTINDGDYLFTLKNIINKKFKLQKGGTIRWSGDPYNATLNMSAIYQVKTPLSPFFPSDSTGLYKRRYLTNCILNLRGNLFSPDIAFDIDLPTVDDGTLQTVKSYLTTEQEMNKQIFSLMVMNSFVTPDQLKSQGTVSSGGNAGTTASSELLSNQLSNWLSQISHDFDVGVNYRPGDLLSSKEMEVALSTQLFNDKMTIDGNFGVAGNATTQTQNTNNIVGDVNIDYKLTNDGKLRVKAFNRSNDNTIVLSNAPYTQGMGIFYREEFNTLSDLFRRFRNKTDKKKSATTK